MEWLSSLIGAFTGGLGKAAGRGIAQYGINKVQGIPSPATGSAAGQLQNEYMNSAFPGSSTLDRLGIGQASAGVEVAKQQQKNQNRDRVFQAGMQERELENRKEVAEIGARAPGVQAETAREKLPAEIANLDAHKQLALKNVLIAIEKAKQEKNKTALSDEAIKYKKLHALYNLGSAAPHVSQILGTGSVAIKMIEMLDAELGAYTKRQKASQGSYIHPGKVTSMPLAAAKPRGQGDWRDFVRKTPSEADAYQKRFKNRHLKPKRKK